MRTIKHVVAFRMSSSKWLRDTTNPFDGCMLHRQLGASRNRMGRSGNLNLPPRQIRRFLSSLFFYYYSRSLSIRMIVAFIHSISTIRQICRSIGICRRVPFFGRSLPTRDRDAPQPSTYSLVFAMKPFGYWFVSNQTRRADFWFL